MERKEGRDLCGPPELSGVKTGVSVAAATAAAASTATTAAAATASSTAATTTCRGKHGVVDDKADSAAEVFDEVDGGFFQERCAVESIKKLTPSRLSTVSSGWVSFSMVSMYWTPPVSGRHGDDAKGAVAFSLLFHDFSKPFDCQFGDLH